MESHATDPGHSMLWRLKEDGADNKSNSLRAIGGLSNNLR